MLCHYSSSRLGEVIFQASRRIIVKSDKLQKKFWNWKKHQSIKFFRNFFSWSPFKYTVFVIYMVKTCILLLKYEDIMSETQPMKMLFFWKSNFSCFWPLKNVKNWARDPYKVSIALNLSLGPFSKISFKGLKFLF